MIRQFFARRRRRRAEQLAAERLELKPFLGGWGIYYWPHGKPCNQGCGFVIAWSSKVPADPHWERIFQREVERILDGFGRTTYYVHSIEGHSTPPPVEMSREEWREQRKESVRKAREYAR